MNDSGKNDPLPVKSRSQAEQQARELVGSLAGQYSLKVDEKTVDKEFRDCLGKDHERAHDGRFDLSYSVRAKLPGDEHGKALRAMRKKLEASGYKVSGYREDPSDALMDARGGADGLFVSVESYLPPTDLVFSVKTPCFLPPGTPQEQLSAPAPASAPAAVPTASALAAGAPGRFPGNPFG
ncbi:hypothetical protein A6A06_08370 [Streptomyces sp. CB02923]|uniref:hypothetical protein n=1 Tax=Streptomyces sp. CB02923 TaxID=1718985 RepID=UPI00093D694E|nr:hypothetical protein [Streptomyces sp. CB02923]OKI04740.1 hypothetical protein A6A06_08370 [Streptomyces sp. CB02923]